MVASKIAIPVLVVAVIGLGVADFVTYQKLSAISGQVALGVNATQLGELTQRVDDVESSVKVMKSDTGAAVPQADFVAAQRATSTRLEAVEQKLSSTTSPKEDVVALKAKIEGIEADIQHLQKPPAAVVSKPAGPGVVAARRPVKKPVMLTPPFQVMGIESRGSERFLAIAPIGSTRLDDVQLIRPGDTQQAWHLDTLDEANATFTVNGAAQVAGVR